MTIDTLIPLASRVLLTSLYQIPLTTGICYNVIDIGVSYAALKYFTSIHRGGDQYLLLGTSSFIGCVAGHFMTSGMDFQTALIINTVSTALIIGVNLGLPVRNDAVRN